MAPTKRSKLSPENTVTKSRLWTQEEDDLLKTLVQTYGSERGKLSNWPCIAAHFPKRSIKNCRKRWFYTLDPTINHGRWTSEEDQRLLQLVETLGRKWKDISFYMEGRTDDQCSSRYLNCLDPNLNSNEPWSKDEDALLLNLYDEMGSSWTLIAKHIPGRSALNCRNRHRKFNNNKPKYGMKHNKSTQNGNVDNNETESCNKSSSSSSQSSSGCTDSEDSSTVNLNTFDHVIKSLFPRLKTEDAFNALLMLHLQNMNPNSFEVPSSPSSFNIESFISSQFQDDIQQPVSSAIVEYDDLSLQSQSNLNSFNI